MPTISDVYQPICIYNPNTLSIELWDGSLNVGSVVIGSVDQGTGGASAWLTKAEATALRFDGSADPILYLGEAAAGSATSAAAWRITRFNVTTGAIAQFADGNTNFDNVWDNRASLSYS